MPVHQDYLSRETALLARTMPLTAQERAAARRAVHALAERLCDRCGRDDAPAAAYQVLAALGIDED